MGKFTTKWISQSKGSSILGYINRFWENFLKIGKEKITHKYLATKRELLDEYWNRFCDTHSELLSYDNIDDSDYMQQDAFLEAENNYAVIKSRTVSAMPAEATGAVKRTFDADAVLKHIQLPKISLPKFSRDKLG